MRLIQKGVFEETATQGVKRPDRLVRKCPRQYWDSFLSLCLALPKNGVDRHLRQSNGELNCRAGVTIQTGIESLGGSRTSAGGYRQPCAFSRLQGPVRDFALNTPKRGGLQVEHARKALGYQP